VAVQELSAVEVTLGVAPAAVVSAADEEAVAADAAAGIISSAKQLDCWIFLT
jgi:hypothetical protein